jgi:hypothetical protein
MMILYLLGALVTGSLGLAVFLGEITAHLTTLSPYAAISLWTGIYILAAVMIMGTGIYMAMR